MKVIFRSVYEKTLVSLRLMGFHCAIHNVAHKNWHILLLSTILTLPIFHFVNT